MVQMGGAPMCVCMYFVWMCVLWIQTEPRWSPLLFIEKSQDVFMCEWSNPLTFNRSVFFYSISLLNGVNHDSLHLLLQKCAFAKQNTIWRLYISPTRRLSCPSYQSNKLRRKENFVFLLASRLWQTISSSLSLILDCFVQLRGEGLESSRCRHVSVCLSFCLPFWSEHAFLVAWQLLWAPNNASPANKCTQQTIHKTSYRHIV